MRSYKDEPYWFRVPTAPRREDHHLVERRSQTKRLGVVPPQTESGSSPVRQPCKGSKLNSRNSPSFGTDARLRTWRGRVLAVLIRPLSTRSIIAHHLGKVQSLTARNRPFQTRWRSSCTCEPLSSSNAFRGIVPLRELRLASLRSVLRHPSPPVHVEVCPLGVETAGLHIDGTPSTRGPQPLCVCLSIQLDEWGVGTVREPHAESLDR